LVLGAEIADAGDGAQDLDRGAKGFDMGVDLLIDLTDGGVDRIDMLEGRAPACVPETTKAPASVTRIGGDGIPRSIRTYQFPN
jgi:hypothetical protein